MEQQTSKKTPGIVLVVIALLLLLGGIGGYGWYQVTQGGDYIGGNVLHLPYLNLWDSEVGMDNPWKSSSFYATLMHRNLFLADSSFQTVQTDLAEDYNVSEDGLTYTITLKEDLLWSDGSPLAVDDVIFSIETVLQHPFATGIYGAAFGQIEGYAAFSQSPELGLSGLTQDGTTLTIQLATPYPTMLQVLAQLVILPQHCFEGISASEMDTASYWLNPVVSGMYQMGEVDETEQTIQLVRNPYYSGVSPQIDEILVHVNYKFANLDYYSTNNITEMINYRSMRTMEEYKVDILFYRYFMFNIQGDDGNQNTAMQDGRVRQAIAMAIDRDSLLYDIYLDSGTLIDSGVPHSNSDWNGVTLSYDPEAAKALLAESDYDMDRPLRLTYYYTDAVSLAFMEGVAEDLEAVGFTVELFWSGGSTELYEDRNYDLALKGLSSFDISEWYTEYTSSKTNLAKLFGGNTAFDPLVEELLITTDQEEQSQLLLELQDLEQELMYKIPLFTLGQVVYINEERVNLPSGITFGNTWYKYDMDFEQWSIKRE